MPRSTSSAWSITICDADARLDARYLSALTSRYLEQPDAANTFFQPVVLFHANIRRLPLPLRVLNSMYSVMQLSRMLGRLPADHPVQLSLALELCHRVGYWDVDVIPEDSHMFFKALFRLGDQVRVVPLFLPVWSDAAEGELVADGTQPLSPGAALGVGRVRRPYLAWQLVIAAVRRSCRATLHAAHYAHEHFLWPSHWFLLVGSFKFLPFLAPTSPASAVGLGLAGRPPRPTRSACPACWS